jgi:mannose-6-phosphate isomerase-like protein (cupin superfamily)
MIRCKEDYVFELRQNMRGGPGAVRIEHLWDAKSELKGNNRLFARLILEPGSGIGFHTHENEEEVFFIVSGKAEADDDGETVVLSSGDTLLTGDGAGHAIEAVGDEPLVIMAVISRYD